MKDRDADGMHKYFKKMHLDNFKLLLCHGFEQKASTKCILGRYKKKTAFKEFGDMVTFDTTFLVNT